MAAALAPRFLAVLVLCNGLAPCFPPRAGDCGYYLHSLELHLPHPITGQPLRLRAPPPPLLMTTLERQEILAVEGLESRGREDGRGP